MAKRKPKEQPKEEYNVLEDDAVPDQGCKNCGIRFGSAKYAESVGKDQAIAERGKICGACELNPNMALVKSMGGGSIVASFFGKVENRWRPITDDDKSCSTCLTKRTANALGPSEEALTLVTKNCLHCKFSKNAAVVAEAEAKAGIPSTTVDNWRSFEA